ncbi:MAG: ABC transporter substrate-binding protein [Acetobacterales bacterium]
MNIRQLIVPAVAVGIAFGAVPAHADKASDTLRWASNSEPDNFDMYMNTLREGIIMGRHVWDSLMEVDPENGDFRPSLAKSFKWIDPTTIEFELNEGIKFHNGEEFNADDVVFTMNYVADPANKVTAISRIQFVAGAEKVDDYTVRVKLKSQFPAAMQYLSSVAVIYPNEYYGKVGPDGMSKEPVGTGPYRATNIDYGNRMEFELFEGYEHGPKNATIGKMVFRRLEERNTQLAELMSGGLDWIWRVPPDQARQLEGRDGLTVTQGATMRIGFLTFDVQGKTGGPDDNPMLNKKVREAISHAIDREQIAKQLMGPAADVLHVFCYPTQFGCSDEGARRYEYDPDKSKELLAEAGYPNGFSTSFHAYRDRPIAEAIIGNLSAIGVRPQLTYVSSGAVRKLRREQGLRLYFGTWGSSSINDVTAVLGNWFQGGPDDQAKDQKVIDLMEKGNTTDEEVRKEAYSAALQRIAEEAFALPLFNWAYNYAYSDNLEFTPSPDEVPRFWNARWK